MTDRFPADSFPVSFARTARLSPFAGRLALARPDLLERLAQAGVPALTGADLEAELAAVPPGDEAALASALRRLRALAMLTIIHRDLAGLADLSEVVSTVTALAEVAVVAAVRHAHAALAAEHGEPADGDRLLVVGMGKLGGCELNFSRHRSDLRR